MLNEYYHGYTDAFVVLQLPSMCKEYIIYIRLYILKCRPTCLQYFSVSDMRNIQTSVPYASRILIIYTLLFTYARSMFLFILIKHKNVYFIFFNLYSFHLSIQCSAAIIEMMVEKSEWLIVMYKFSFNWLSLYFKFEINDKESSDVLKYLPTLKYDLFLYISNMQNRIHTVHCITLFVTMHANYVLLCQIWKKVKATSRVLYYVFWTSTISVKIFLARVSSFMNTLLTLEERLHNCTNYKMQQQLTNKVSLTL